MVQPAMMAMVAMLLLLQLLLLGRVQAASKAYAVAVKLQGSIAVEGEYFVAVSLGQPSNPFLLQINTGPSCCPPLTL